MNPARQQMRVVSYEKNGAMPERLRVGSGKNAMKMGSKFVAARKGKLVLINFK